MTYNILHHNQAIDSKGLHLNHTDWYGGQIIDVRHR
jgi:hypothetical protein